MIAIRIYTNNSRETEKILLRWLMNWVTNPSSIYRKVSKRQLLGIRKKDGFKLIY